MGKWASLGFVLALKNPFFTARVCTYTTESVVLARANEFDTGRRGIGCRREVGGWNRPDEPADWMAGQGTLQSLGFRA